MVVMGEPGGLFVNDRETGEFLWAAPLPYTSTERFVIRDIDVETGAVYINMDLVAKEVGQRFVICGHNVKSWWSWSYSPVTGLLYIPFNRSCLDQTANDQTISGASPRVSIAEPGLEDDGDLTEVRAIDISTGRERGRYSQRAPQRRLDARDGGQRRLLRRPPPPVSGLRRRDRSCTLGDDSGQPDHRLSCDLRRRWPAVPDGAGRWRGESAEHLRARAGGTDGEQHARDVHAAVAISDRRSRPLRRPAPRRARR